MTNTSRISIYGSFFLKAIFMASVIMFVCMALGELFYDENLFSGFLRKPILWVGIFLETTVATLFMTTLGALVLYRFRSLNKMTFARVSVAVWCFLGLVVILLYRYFYWTRDWHITEVAAGLVFGWILPGLLSVLCFAWLSLDLRLADQENWPAKGAGQCN